MAECPTIRKKLEAELADIMGANISIKSSTLLQAYATFVSISALDEANFSTAYKNVQEENKACKWAILRGLTSPIPVCFPVAFKSFIEISSADFFGLLFRIWLVTRSSLIVFSEQYDENLMLCVHHIIQVKLVAYTKLKPVEATDTTYEEAVNKLGSEVHFFRDVYDGAAQIEVLEGWEPIYWPGAYWTRQSWDGFSALCYHVGEEPGQPDPDAYSVYTIDTTRTDLQTYQGIWVSSTREEVLEAYPDLYNTECWHASAPDFPGDDYLWYCVNPNGFGAAILFFFEGDVVSQIRLNNMFN